MSMDTWVRAAEADVVLDILAQTLTHQVGVNAVGRDKRKHHSSSIVSKGDGFGIPLSRYKSRFPPAM